MRIPVNLRRQTIKAVAIKPKSTANLHKDTSLQQKSPTHKQVCRLDLKSTTGLFKSNPRKSEETRPGKQEKFLDIARTNP